MTDALPLRIFLASSSDVAAERRVVETCVTEHNARRRESGDTSYEVIGWERVRGTARRPQEAINELIGECHFMIVLFKQAWGSEPGSPWGYTSGTEEELFTALLELGSADRPMRDVWVAFLDHPEPAAEIVGLRARISENHSLFYETVTDAADLKAKLTERLQTWGNLTRPKVPRSVELLPSTGQDVLGAASRRVHGEKLVELGQPEAGREQLREASVLGGPLEHLAYARLLARGGELEEALEFARRAIASFYRPGSMLHSPLAARAFAAEAGVLRRQGHNLDAIGRLRQALSLLSEEDTATRSVRCQILDDLGLAQQRVGDLDAARSSLTNALELRRNAGLTLEVCQSRINLARLEVGAENLEDAATIAEEVVVTLRGTPPTTLHANAEVLVAQVRLRQGRAAEGLPFAERALSINRQIASTHGEAISLYVLAQSHRSLNNVSESRSYATTCLELNISMGNTTGAKNAQWQLDQLPN